jgi:hypothetical protein
MAGQSLYDTLGVPPDATAEEIKAAYRRHLKYWHPDHNTRPDALARAKAINEAYEVLADPVRRADYDRTLAAEGAPPPPPSGTPPDGGPPPWSAPPGRYRRRRPTTGTHTGAGSAGSASAFGGPPPPPPGANPPPWTAPPGRYRRRPPATGAGPLPFTAPGWGGSPFGPDPRRARAAGLTGWGDTPGGARIERLAAQLRVAVAWLVRPLRQPAPGRAFAGAILVRVGALVAAGAALWLGVPVVLTVIRLVVDLLALLAMLLLFGLALGATGGNRRRRR